MTRCSAGRCNAPTRIARSREDWSRFICRATGRSEDRLRASQFFRLSVRAGPRAQRTRDIEEMLHGAPYRTVLSVQSAVWPTSVSQVDDTLTTNLRRNRLRFIVSVAPLNSAPETGTRKSKCATKCVVYGSRNRRRFLR